MNEKIKVNDSNIFVGIIMCECVIVTNYRHVGGFFIYILNLLRNTLCAYCRISIDKTSGSLWKEINFSPASISRVRTNRLATAILTYVGIPSYPCLLTA